MTFLTLNKYFFTKEAQMVNYDFNFNTGFPRVDRRYAFLTQTKGPYTKQFL